MRRFIIIFIAAVLISGCNIIPKSMQYQKEEEKTIGSVDVVNPLVEEAQIVLDTLGYDTGTMDGRIGKKTRQAIKEFQESIGLRSTGYIDKRTWRAVEDIMRENENRDMKKDYNIEVRSPYLQEIYDPESKLGVTMKQIQAALQNAGFDPGAIDGKAGPRTQQAIKEFQRTKGLKIDGKVGPQTWTELGKYLK
ncbi:peptidoglycan-binding protein [Candidatus Omnitrophota bacterium]